MKESELVAAIRDSAMLSTADDVFTAVRLRQELTDAIRTLFGKDVATTRCGYWRKVYETTTTSGRSRYRLPPRAVVGAVESIEVPEMGGLRFDFEGDQIVFIDENGTAQAPDAGLTLRMRYLLRPSQIVEEQTAGRVTAVDINSRVVTVNSLPVNRVTTATIATNDKLDIVHPNGWHELAVVDIAATIAGLNVTFPSTADLSDVEVGDYVRAADQTEWPCLPEDYHRTLVDAVCFKALRSKNMLTKAKPYAETVAAELERFKDQIQPRVKDAPPPIVPRYGVIRGGRRRVERWAGL